MTTTIDQAYLAARRINGAGHTLTDFVTERFQSGEMGDIANLATQLADARGKEDWSSKNYASINTIVARVSKRLVEEGEIEFPLTLKKQKLDDGTPVIRVVVQDKKTKSTIEKAQKALEQYLKLMAEVQGEDGEKFETIRTAHAIEMMDAGLIGQA